MFDLKKIESSVDCISGYDSELRIVIWNEATEREYGIKKKNAIGSFLLELFPHIADYFRVKCFRQSISDHKTFFFASLPYQYRDGIYTQLIIPDGQAAPHRILSIVRDHAESERYTRADLLTPLLSENGLPHQLPPAPRAAGRHTKSRSGQ